MMVVRGASRYSATEELLRVCREGLGVVITTDRYRGFRTFRRVREVKPPIIELILRGGCWESAISNSRSTFWQTSGMASDGLGFRTFRPMRLSRE